MPPTHAPDVRTRLHLHEEVPIERLGLSPDPASKRDPASPRIESFADWRPRLASFPTLLTLALLGAVPAAALAVARTIAAARHPTAGPIAAQIGTALFLTFLVVQWVRPAQRARPLHVLGIAASTTSLVLPAAVVWLRPILAAPAAEMPSVVAGRLVGLAFTAAAIPPLLFAFRTTENTDCHTAPRVAFTSGIWLLLIATITAAGAPTWFAFCAASTALLAAALLFYAGRRSSQDASALEGAVSQRSTRLRVVREPQEAAALPPDLVPIGDDEHVAWLLCADADESPYRAAATGVPVVAIPLPADRALRDLKSRRTVAFVMGSLSVTLAATQLGQPAPRRITDLLLTEDRVMVELSDGTVESTTADLDPAGKNRSKWQLLSSSGVLATTDPRLLHLKPAPTVRGDGSALFPFQPDPSRIELVAGRMHACSLHEGGVMRCWGENDAGQLGRPPSSFGQVAEIKGLTDIAEIRAHGDMTCARTKQLRVFCWGHTEGAFTDSGPASSPREVLELPDVVRFEADERGVCGIRPDGRLACWPHRTSPRDGDSESP